MFAVWRHVGVRKLAASALREMIESEGFRVENIETGDAPEAGSSTTPSMRLPALKMLCSFLTSPVPDRMD